ncbi:MAG: carboxypeptidase-like regulatory domain-containing protein [Thermoplasmata archaeon]
MRPIVAIALALVAVVSAGLIGALANYGVEATAPFHYSITGDVYLPSGAAATGAHVVLTTDGGALENYNVTPNGTFYFEDVPSGGASLNVTLLGYAPITVDTFASPVYNAGTTGLGIGLAVGNASNGTTVILSPFPDLESFVSTIGAEAVLLGLVAVVAGAIAALTYRRDRFPLGVVAGGSGVAVPATLYLLGLSSVFPTVAIAAGVAGSLGAFAMALNAIQLARSGAPVRSG